MIEVYRWRQLERWDAFTIPHLHIAPHLPQKSIGELLTPRHSRVDREKWSFDQLQPITIHFGGDISRRKVAAGTEYTLPLFWVQPGDVVLSKIDLKNGAVGVLPEGWNNVVVTSHFKVYSPDVAQLDPRYFRLLLQTQDFKAWLWANRSGADGRTEVKLDVFEALSIPLPPISRQNELCDAYSLALTRAAQLEQEAEAIERAGWQAFETALGVAPPPPLPDRPVFVARFKDVERWSHDGILRGALGREQRKSNVSTVPLGSVLLDVRHGCSKGPSNLATNLRVLKISAVTRGRLDLDECKFIYDEPALREQFSLKAGDILMCRTNGTLGYVGMSALVIADIDDMIFPDKVIRVRADHNRIKPEFLWRLLQVSAVRSQIENAARTAVGNFAIGGKDIKSLNVPLPKLVDQGKLIRTLSVVIASAVANRAEAANLRQSAWATFEATLFTNNVEPAV
ncbi:MAG: restriction endonuclease subunit S [Methylococcus sp.]